MPTAPPRACATCGALITGPCPTCRRTRDRYRGSAASRGYGHVWQAFRPQFMGMLVAAGIPPVCGARLPNGPTTSHSQCRAAGLINGTDLHLHHEPPLSEAERQDVRAVCDPTRIEALCSTCHNAETGSRAT